MIVAAGRLRLPDLVAAGPALPTVMSDLHMRVVLGGRQRTANEYRDLLAQAGLRMTRLIPTEPDYAAVEAVVAD